MIDMAMATLISTCPRDTEAVWNRWCHGQELFGPEELSWKIPAVHGSLHSKNVWMKWHHHDHDIHDVMYWHSLLLV